MYPYVTSKNIRNGYMDLTNIEYVSADFHQTIYPRCNPEFGDVLLTKDGANTGNVTINTLDEPFSILSSVCLIKPDPQKLLSKWLMYYIQSSRGFNQITGQMTGAAIKRIILRTIKQSQIPLPPIPEQKRIVAILDEAFEGIDRAIANTEKNLANARELFEAYLKSCFAVGRDGWFTTKAQDLFDTITPRKKVQRKDYLDIGSIPVVSQEFGLINGYWNNPGDITQSDGPIIVFGDHTRALKYVDFPFVVGADGTKLLRAKSRANSRCLFFALSSLELAGKGYARHFKALKEANVSLPGDMEEQEQLASCCGRMEIKCSALQKNYERKLGALADLKQSVLKKAFSGELNASLLAGTQEAAQ